MGCSTLLKIWVMGGRSQLDFLREMLWRKLKRDLTQLAKSFACRHTRAFVLAKGPIGRAML
jgi:predicted thioredoxin/glutaredoxin